MSAGDNANCCSRRLSIVNLQGHTPWVFFWVHKPRDVDSVMPEKHTSDSLVVRHFRAAPVGVHVVLDSTTVSIRLPGARLVLCQIIWHAVCQRRSPSP